MGYKDPDKQREYQRQWKAARRAEFFKDKVCVRCGSTKNLELDHIDRSTKVSHNIWSWSKKRREAEIEKCQVLCRDCHKAKSLKFGDQGKPGETNPMSKLREIDIKYIFALRESGMSQKEIGAEFGINQTAVGKVLRRVTWSHLEM